MIPQNMGIVGILLGEKSSVAAAPKTADEDTSASNSNVGWSMTPPTQEDGLKKWQEQNPDVEVSFGN